MVEREIGLTDGGGGYIELTDDAGDVRRIEFEPTTNGQMDVVVETPRWRSQAWERRAGCGKR